MEQSLDGPLPILCQAVMLSHQDGHHSAVALLLKAALIQVSDQTPGSLWLVMVVITELCRKPQTSFKQLTHVVPSTLYMYILFLHCCHVSELSNSQPEQTSDTLNLFTTCAFTSHLYLKLYNLVSVSLCLINCEYSL